MTKMTKDRAPAQIKVHGSVMDNAGDQHHAGTVLSIDDDGGKGCVTATHAKQLLKINSATVVEPE
jgi:hypothetical protein